jgi:hypothetical protein
MQVYGRKPDQNFGRYPLSEADKPNMFYSITFCNGPSRVHVFLSLLHLLVEADEASEVL